MARFCLRRAALASGCVTTRPTTDSRVIRQAPARAGRGPLHHRFRRPQYRQPGSPSRGNFRGCPEGVDRCPHATYACAREARNFASTGDRPRRAPERFLDT